ncbi:MAG: cation diffusion facilitator family transporter [Methanomassiliicoccales archaeon]|nr:cation diffusion facilitator family transporter [Methanomassiliicoccales archaeon]
MKRVKAAKVSIISNASLVCLKLVAGLIMFSISIISEALHSIMDLIAAIVANYSVRKATEPADSDHTYGHGKYENMAGVVEALLIFFASAIIIYESGMKIISGTGVEYIEIGIVIMGVSAIVNFFVSRYLWKVAEDEDSIALKADSLHLKTDVITSLGVFLGLIVMSITKLAFFDPLIAIGIAFLILRAAYNLFKESSRGLVDEKLPAEEEMVVRNVLIEHMPSYIEFHSLRTRKAGNQRFIDMHVVVRPEMSVEDSHKIVDHLEQEIAKRLPNTSVLIHVEPQDWRNSPALGKKGEI